MLFKIKTIDGWQDRGGSCLPKTVRPPDGSPRSKRGKFIPLGAGWLTPLEAGQVYPARSGTAHPPSPHQAPPKRYAQARRLPAPPYRYVVARWRAGRSRIDSDRLPLTAHRSLTKAFTLLEVLLAMVLVAVMVLLISNLFRQVSGVWNIGTQTADMNTAARAAMDLIASELEQAVAGPIESAEHPGQSLAFKLYNSDDWPLRFLTLTHNPGYSENYYRRALRAVYVRHNSEKNLLEYGRKTAASVAVDFTTLDCYYAPIVPNPTNWYNSPAETALLITNVFDFRALAYASPADVANGNGVAQYDSTDLAYNNQLPYCVDLYLEVLGDDDARKAANLPAGPTLNNFLDRNARRYTTRVYFLNREGFKPR